MKKVFVAIALITALFPILSYAYVPFGGTVTKTLPCNTGTLLFVKTPTSVGTYMWTWGNLQYASFRPPYMSQKVLGLASPTPMPCVLGFPPAATYNGAGLPIIFHGSSL